VSRALGKCRRRRDDRQREGERQVTHERRQRRTCANLWEHRRSRVLGG
jgi:hypothetical protein